MTIQILIPCTDGNNRLLLLRDPTLVRAAQLVILKLRNIEGENVFLESQTIVERIVEVFGAIENRFCEQLKYRLSNLYIYMNIFL